MPERKALWAGYAFSGLTSHVATSSSYATWCHLWLSGLHPAWTLLQMHSTVVIQGIRSRTMEADICLPRMQAQTCQEDRQSHWKLRVYAVGITLHTGTDIRKTD